ncbi:energy transducer TonB [Fibrella aquatilis]|uniref:Energy transducer TonB n=1 Tax=Fibrella aquatilis TaxID=2817059 RepID=A0A939G9K7_9BACT|nr:energy transducer TonB [Fibrella aquatilis]MBO0932627.1 energy transducer TonB [Fibrella aquatilis]
MKRIVLSIASLCLSGSLAWAQSAQTTGSAIATSAQHTAIGCYSPFTEATPDEYVPLNNPPFFPGGPKALAAYFLNPDLYPYVARTNDLEGTVQVSFRIQPTGFLTSIRVTKSHSPLLDWAALRAVAQMPRWYPAHQTGIAVICPVQLSIRFETD